MTFFTGRRVGMGGIRKKTALPLDTARWPVLKLGLARSGFRRAPGKALAPPYAKESVSARVRLCAQSTEVPTPASGVGFRAGVGRSRQRDVKIVQHAGQSRRIDQAHHRPGAELRNRAI